MRLEVIAPALMTFPAGIADILIPAVYGNCTSTLCSVPSYFGIEV
jgi:hypothetical protein